MKKTSSLSKVILLSLFLSLLLYSSSLLAQNNNQPTKYSLQKAEDALTPILHYSSSVPQLMMDPTREEALETLSRGLGVPIRSVYNSTPSQGISIPVAISVAIAQPINESLAEECSTEERTNSTSFSSQRIEENIPERKPIRNLAFRVIAEPIEKKINLALPLYGTASIHFDPNKNVHALSLSDYRNKAIEAETAGNPELADCWIKVIQVCELAADYYTQSDVAYATGDREEGDRLGQRGSVGHIIMAVSNLLWMSEMWVKVEEARATGKLELANHWIEALEDYEKSAAYAIRAAAACAAGNKEKEDRLSTASCITQVMTFSLEERMEKWAKFEAARIAGKEELANRWLEALQAHEKSTEYCTQATLAYIAGNKEASARLALSKTAYDAASSSDRAASPLAKRAEIWAQFEEAQSTGSKELANYWLEAIQAYEKEASYWMQSASAYATGNTEIGNCLGNGLGDGTNGAASSIGAAASWLVRRAEAQSNFEEAHSTGKNEHANYWREKVQAQEKSIGYWTQSAAAYAEGKKNEGDRLREAALQACILAQQN